MLQEIDDGRVIFDPLLKQDCSIARTVVDGCIDTWSVVCIVCMRDCAGRPRGNRDWSWFPRAFYQQRLSDQGQQNMNEPEAIHVTDRLG
jgi:hypothetical protein